MLKKKDRIQEKLTLVKSLEASHSYDEAIKLLESDKQEVVENDFLFEALLRLYKITNKLKKREQLFTQKINLDSGNQALYFRLGRNSVLLKEYAKAEHFFVKGLESKFNEPMKDILIELRNKIGLSDSYESQYQYSTGRRNYGVIIHSNGEDSFITKITSVDKLAKREAQFYESVCELSQNLKKIIPEFLNVFVFRNLQFLTVEFVKGEKVGKEEVDKVVNISKDLYELPYDQLNENAPNLNYRFKLSNKPNPYINIFTRIHDKKQNELLFRRSYEMMSRYKYPSKLIETVKRLENLVFSNHVYYFIRPNRNYSLIHGDLNRSNVKVNNEIIKVIDWETFKLGPKGLDMARLFSASLLTYKEIEEKYLQEQYLTINEEIIFVYCLIFLYLTTLSKEKCIEGYDVYFEDALKGLTSKIKLFKINKEYQKTLLYQIEEREDLYSKEKKKFKKEIENQNKELSIYKNKVKQIVAKKNSIEKKYNLILNSKSWRLTKPFRLFLQKLKKLKRL